MATLTGREPDALDAEVEALYAALMGRRNFSYRAEDDPLYRSYADRYVQNGRMAMRDAMGSAAALTGGYGSSYAQAAGQQQYDEYLRQLSEALPELYGLAYQQYIDEGEALRERYEIAAGRLAGEQSAAYQRERDAIEDERYRLEQESKLAQQSYKQQQDSYQNLVKLISGSGYMPTDAELAAAGLSRASAEALRKEYERSRGLNQPAKTVVYYKSAAGTTASTSANTNKSHQSTGSSSVSGRSSGAYTDTGYKGGLSQR